VTQRTKAEVASGVQELEEAYGAMLIERGPDGYRLTKAGRGVLESHEKRRADGRGETEGRDGDWTPDEPLRISMDDAFAALHLPHLVSVAERYPNLRLVTRLSDPSQNPAALEPRLDSRPDGSRVFEKNH